ncbi:MAG: hypothetical protein WAP12_02070 [Saccharofermentanales bacterium]|jgi:hypothetical protein
MERHMLLDTYQKLEKRLARLDFTSLWQGFVKRSYALYTDESMCICGKLLPKPDYFYGNTAIEYDGKMIAIWMLKPEQAETDEDLDKLAAKLVHEMFHVMQMENGESRFPHDLELIAFPLDPELVALTNRENDLLEGYADRMTSDDNVSETDRQKQLGLDAITILAKIAEIRSAMRTLSDGATINAWRAETIEGVAEYVGFKSLRQLNSELAAREVSVYVTNLRKATEALDHRRHSYYAGLLLSSLADTAGIDFNRSFASEKTLWEFIEEQVLASQDISMTRKLTLTDEELEKAHAIVDMEKTRREEKLASFQAKFPLKKPVQASICGYDPMNIMRVGDFLLSTSFLMIDQEGEKHRMFGDHLIRMKPGDFWNIEALYEAN